MIIGIHHAQITVPRDSEDAAREFYTDTLELEEIPKPETLASRGGFWLQVGENELHVGVEDGIDPSATKAHVALEVTDLNEWRHRLRDKGVKIDKSIPIPGHERFEFRDPFNNRIELIQVVEEE